MTSEVTQADRLRADLFFSAAEWLHKDLRTFTVAKMQFAAHRLRAEQACKDAAAERERELVGAARGLIADVRRRYPGEDLRCPYMIALNEALAPYAAWRDEQIALSAAPAREDVADTELTPTQIRLLQRGLKEKWIGLSDHTGQHMHEVAALGELRRAGLVRPTEDVLPPGPPVVPPYEITDEGRAALAKYGEQDD